MTTTISPASGAGCLFTQQGIGTTPGFSALDDRRSNSGSLQEGVYGTSTLVTAGGVSNVVAADFVVTQRAAGANMSVDVNMPAGGFAYVQGDTINGQGLYTVPVHSANINEAIAAADPTNPRVDQVILEIQDNVLDASGGNLARTRVLTGTPQPGATLANRTGAVGLPGSALLLADVLVPAVATTIPNSGIRDRRKWARGAYDRVIDTTGDITQTVTASVVAFGPTFRIESAGLPLKIGLRCRLSANATTVAAFFPLVDGVVIDGMTATNGSFRESLVNLTESFSVLEWVTIPAAGSHTIQWGSTVTASSAIYGRSAAFPMEVYAEEVVRQNAANSNGVTTG